MSSAPAFALDARLAADTVPLASTASSQLLLMNDARWPWLIVVPRLAGATEMHLLPPALRDAVHREIDRTAAALHGATGCRSINVAALGNIVSQLHVHVVARQVDDPNWPGPIWGFERAQRRSTTTLPEFARQVLRILDETRPHDAARFIAPG